MADDTHVYTDSNTKELTLGLHDEGDGTLSPQHYVTGIASQDITAVQGGTIASDDTAEHAFAAQAVKAPVTIKIGKEVTGAVTIRKGTAGPVLEVLEWDATDGHHNPACLLYVANMSELTYQFSVDAASELIRWSSGN
jgi:hypothetical protein